MKIKYELLMVFICAEVGKELRLIIACGSYEKLTFTPACLIANRRPFRFQIKKTCRQQRQKIPAGLPSAVAIANIVPRFTPEPDRPGVFGTVRQNTEKTILAYEGNR